MKSMGHAFTFDFDNSYFIKNLFFSYAIVWEKLPMDTTVQEPIAIGCDATKV